MPSRHHQSAWRRRYHRKQAIRTALPVAIPVALAAAAGAVVAFSGGGGAAHINQSALADCASPPASTAPSAGAAPSDGAVPSAGPTPSGAAAPGAGAVPCPSGSASASPPATATAPAGSGAGRSGPAGPDPVDPTGKAISLTQSAQQAANTQNCTLTVPPDPLSAAGLATPWQLGDGCAESNPAEQAFVEATILAPGGQLSVYDPLVVTHGTTPAAPPLQPTIPAGSRIIINVGFNGANLVLTGAGAAQGQCVDSFGNSVISQTAACDAPAFYADANAQIASGTLKVPPLGTGSDGQPCPTTESFSLIDQDQSDNVDTAYLLNGHGQTAQDTPANQQAVGGAATITNGSDDGLLAHFVDPALGCAPFKAANDTSPSGTDSSQALEALSARQNQAYPRALLPVSDPQLLVGGQPSAGKVNAYRAAVDQPPLPAGADPTRNAELYCRNMVSLAPSRLQRDLAAERAFASPDAATGTSLATFLGARLSASFGNLGCQKFGLRNPVKITANDQGVATGVAYGAGRHWRRRR